MIVTYANNNDLQITCNHLQVYKVHEQTCQFMQYPTVFSYIDIELDRTDFYRGMPSFSNTALGLIHRH